MRILHTSCTSARSNQTAFTLAFQTYTTFTWAWALHTGALSLLILLCVLSIDCNFRHLDHFRTRPNARAALNFHTSSRWMLQAMNGRRTVGGGLVLGIFNGPGRIEITFIEIVLLNWRRLLLHYIEEIILSNGYRIVYRINRYSINYYCLLIHLVGISSDQENFVKLNWKFV